MSVITFMMEPISLVCSPSWRMSSWSSRDLSRRAEMALVTAAMLWALSAAVWPRPCTWSDTSDEMPATSAPRSRERSMRWAMPWLVELIWSEAVAMPDTNSAMRSRELLTESMSSQVRWEDRRTTWAWPWESSAAWRSLPAASVSPEENAARVSAELFRPMKVSAYAPMTRPSSPSMPWPASCPCAVRRNRPRRMSSTRPAVRMKQRSSPRAEPRSSHPAAARPDRSPTIRT